MEEARLVQHVTHVLRQEGRDAVKLELRAPDVGRDLQKFGTLQSQSVRITSSFQSLFTASETAPPQKNELGQRAPSLAATHTEPFRFCYLRQVVVVQQIVEGSVGRGAVAPLRPRPAAPAAPLAAPLAPLHARRSAAPLPDGVVLPGPAARRAVAAHKGVAPLETARICEDNTWMFR